MASTSTTTVELHSFARDKAGVSEERDLQKLNPTFGEGKGLGLDGNGRGSAAGEGESRILRETDVVDGTGIGSGEGIRRGGGEISRRRAAVVITTVAGVNFLNTLGSGILTVALPKIAGDLGLGRGLLLWPASIYALTCGCTLLLAGSVADILGRRLFFLTGCILYSLFTLGCGFSRSALQLLIFRAFQGISISLCLTTAIGIISTTFPERSTKRNIAFASTGAASPVGYTVGLVMGGVFVDGIGWRWGYWIGFGINAFLVGGAVWGLPKDEEGEATREESIWWRLGREIDWIGAVIATVSISLLSYVLAVITGSSSSIHEVQNIVLLSVALALLPAFVFWMRHQEKHGRPAIIPNSIWKRSAFICSCIAVFLTWGAFNPFGYFTTLFFPEIESLSALQTSLRFLPTVVCGVLTNIATGFLVTNTSASYLVAASSVFSAVACVLMALVHPSWSFWAAAFPAVFLSPMSSDVLYTISNLIIADAFPPSKQSLAGGVFNTVSQVGNSVGLTVGAVIASSVTGSTSGEKEALLNGYRATFWTCFASLMGVAVVSVWGLKKAGKVGLKAD